MNKNSDNGLCPRCGFGQHCLCTSWGLDDSRAPERGEGQETGIDWAEVWNSRTDLPSFEKANFDDYAKAAEFGAQIALALIGEQEKRTPISDKPGTPEMPYVDSGEQETGPGSWRKPTEEEWESFGAYMASRTEEWDRRVVHQVVDEVAKFLDKLPAHPNTEGK